VIAGLGYIADGFVAVLVRDPSISIAQFTFVGEVALMFWLLIKGARKDFSGGEAGRSHHFDPDSLWLADHQSTSSTVGQRS
jgi:hypothetical protein